MNRRVISSLLHGLACLLLIGGTDAFAGVRPAKPGKVADNSLYARMLTQSLNRLSRADNREWLPDGSPLVSEEEEINCYVSASMPGPVTTTSNPCPETEFPNPFCPVTEYPTPGCPFPGMTEYPSIGCPPVQTEDILCLEETEMPLCEHTEQYNAECFLDSEYYPSPNCISTEWYCPSTENHIPICYLTNNDWESCWYETEMGYFCPPTVHPYPVVCELTDQQNANCYYETWTVGCPGTEAPNGQCFNTEAPACPSTDHSHPACYITDRDYDSCFNGTEAPSLYCPFTVRYVPQACENPWEWVSTEPESGVQSLVALPNVNRRHGYLLGLCIVGLVGLGGEVRSRRKK